MPRPLSARAIGGDLGRLGVLALVIVAIVAGYVVFRIWDEGSRDDARPVGAIVVMGAAQYDGFPSPVLAARLDHAIELWNDGRAPYLVVTGGKKAGDRTTEAAAARAYAERKGVPATAILAETEGRTTKESIDGVGRLLAENGIGEVVFVSDPTHMLRVLRMANDRGIRAVGSPTRTSPIEADAGRRVSATIHEAGALAWYFLRGDQVAPPEAGLD